MPGGDGTGPMGMGPMTGRAAGYCAGNSVPGYMTPGPGRGFGMGRGLGGRGRGGGWGRRNWFWATGTPGWARGGLPAVASAEAGVGIPARGGYLPYGVPPTPEQELDVLKGQAEYFSGALDDIKKRIEELGADRKAE